MTEGIGNTIIIVENSCVCVMMTQVLIFRSTNLHFTTTLATTWRHLHFTTAFSFNIFQGNTHDFAS